MKIASGAGLRAANWSKIQATSCNALRLFTLSEQTILTGLKLIRPH